MKWMQTTILTKTNLSKIAIIITAAGSSTRMGSGIKKEYLSLKNGTVLSNCANTFLKACLKNFQITDFIITCPCGGIQKCREVLNADNETCTLFAEWKKAGGGEPVITEGGNSRQASVLNGLKAVTNQPEIVLIHDGARPFVTEKIITDCICSALEYGASVPGITPTDTQKEIDENGFIIRHLQRSSLTSVQTPQCFNYEKLLAAHEKARADKKEYTDDTEIWGVYCGSVKVVPGDACNKKITYPGDL